MQKCLCVAASDTSSKLMKLRQSESFGIFDNHNICVRHVYADFNYRCRYKYVNLSAHKNSSITSSFSFAFIFPCIRPILNSGNIACNFSASISAFCKSLVSVSSISGHTTYACIPALTFFCKNAKMRFSHTFTDCVRLNGLSSRR